MVFNFIDLEKLISVCWWYLLIEQNFSELNLWTNVARMIISLAKEEERYRIIIVFVTLVSFLT